MSTTNTRLDLNKVAEIVFQDIDRLLESFNLDYTQDADNIFMKCPIHSGSDNPTALSMSLDKKMWRCWTRGCHDHYQSNIFGFVKGMLDTDSFSDALRYICKLYDVNQAKENHDNTNYRNNNTDSDDAFDFGKVISSIKKPRKANGHSGEYVSGSRPTTEKTPSPYFISRGFEPATLEHFGVRDTPAGTSGVLRHRSIIPINDSNGDYCGYIGRATRDFIQPKYIFSKGIRKSDYLYNYHRAVNSLVHLDAIFLVEGQGDVWKLWECGVNNVVGLFGKDISTTQKSLLLTSGVTTLVVLTDNDQAGRESKIKIKRDMSRLFKLVFPKMHTKDLGNMFVENIQENILKDLKGYY